MSATTPQSPLARALERDGAVWQGASTAAHFGDPAAELVAARTALALVDRTPFARLRADGPDLLELLNRLSTAELKNLGVGDGRPTVLTTNKGRIVERLFVSHLGESDVLLVASPDSADRVLEHLARYTFAEKTGLADVTAETVQLGLVGPRAREALEGLGLAAPAPYAARLAELAGHPVTVCAHDGFSPDGYSLVGAAEAGEALWTAAAEATQAAGGRPAGTLASEAARVLAGRPAGGAELNEDYNPLEAGLVEAVSFTKGCYVGQEVVARLNTYDKVSRALVGVNLPDPAPPPEAGTPLHRDGREVGRVTSALLPPGWPHAVALAYVKRKHAAPGDRVQIGDVEAGLIELPWPTDP